MPVNDTIKTPNVPGGVTDSIVNPNVDDTVTKTAEEIAAEEAAKTQADDDSKGGAADQTKASESDEGKDEGAKDDVANPESTIVITTDEGDITYELDAEGNAVKDGKVVYTKAELDAFEEPAEITLDDVSKLSGIVPLNADGTPKVYDMTVEGLAKRDADIADLARKQAYDSAVDEFFKTNPDIYQAALYKQTYGTLDGFGSYTDWSTITLENKGDDQLEAIIRSAEKKKGSSDAAIDRIIKFSKADKVLQEAAQESLEYLARNQKAEQEAALAEQDAKWQAEQDALDRAYGITYDENGKAQVLNVKDSLYDKIVNQGVLAGLNIPTAGVKRKVNGKEEILTRKDLVRYLTEPVIQQGDAFYTRAQADVMKMLSDNEMFSAIAIRNLLGADINQLAEATVRIQAARRLNIASKANPKVKISSGSNATKVNPNRKPVVPGGTVDSK